MSLKKYSKKRNFKKTPEPNASSKSKDIELVFVVHKHNARRLHYDLRLEAGGALKSWAIPKGPSLNPSDKRLAIMVEDHPMNYRFFEGVIPKGNYGAGEVIIWDRGAISVPEVFTKKEAEKKLLKGIEKGRVVFSLKGEKLKGEFALAKIKKGEENAWLLIKKNDEHAEKKDVTELDYSVESGKRIGDLKGHEEKPLDENKKTNTSAQELEGYGAVKKPFIGYVEPMLARLIEEPFENEKWGFEIKWDGYRTICCVKSANTQLFSRRGKLFEKFNHIKNSIATIGFDAVLDGEIVALDKDGKPDFQALQNYLQEEQANLFFYIFDILYMNGYDLTSIPYEYRREILENSLGDFDNVRISEMIVGKGKDIFAAVTENGLEGVVGKRLDSYYESGKRSGSWVKIKNIKKQEVVIAGFTNPRGNRKHIGSLVVGVYEEGRFSYAGHVSVGSSSEKIKKLYTKLLKYKKDSSPFKEDIKTNEKVTWVEPVVVAEVKFTEWTSEGSLRHAQFIGIRDDKDALDVVREKEYAMKKNVLQKESENREKTIIQLADGPLVISNPDKFYWEKEGISKMDMVSYYERISDMMLPYLLGRPQSLNRFPQGARCPGFYQKDVQNPPDWAETCRIRSESDSKETNYLVCSNKRTLLYMANLGCIEINPWNSRVGLLEKPDYAVLDLDPHEIGFEAVIETAQIIRGMLEELEIKSFPKTSGATGLHIFIPLGAKYTYEQARLLANLLAVKAHQRIPQKTSIKRMPSQRKGKVYIDYLQNSRDKTIVAPYSLRPREGAPVSTPLEWEEVREGLDPMQFTYFTIFERVQKKGDLWKDTLKDGIDIEKILKKLEFLK